MAFKFRKRVKILPGVHVNLGKKGVSSVSIGKRGASLNIGKNGVKGTIGLNGSGLSYTSSLSNKATKNESALSERETEPHKENNASKFLVRVIKLTFRYIFIAFLALILIASILVTYSSQT